MWVRLTFINARRNMLDEVRRVYYEEIVPEVRAQKGNVEIFLLEPEDPKDTFISCTMWESKEDGDAYEASGTYARLRDRLKHTFEGQPTLRSYTSQRKLQPV